MFAPQNAWEVGGVDAGTHRKQIFRQAKDRISMGPHLEIMYILA